MTNQDIENNNDSKEWTIIVKEKNKETEQKTVVNDDSYQVEIAKDVSIPIVETELIDVPSITAGLITRDLVSRGEKILEKRYKDEKKK